MNENHALRDEACALLSGATQRIQTADLKNDQEWEAAVDSALTDMESVSSLFSIINNPEAISGLLEMTKLKTWSELLWNDSGNWNRATGYAVNCSCDRGDYHLILTEPKKSVRCVKKDEVIVLKYLPNL